MGLLTVAQLRFVRFAPWSTLTVLAGVALAVASIVAVHQISRQVVESLEAVMPPYLEDVSYLLDRQKLTMADYFALRERWREGDDAGLVALMPLVDGVVGTDAGTLRLVGVDPFSGVAAVAGLALVTPGAVVVAPELDGVRSLVMNGRRYPIGLVHEGVPRGMVVTDIGTAQSALGRDDEALDRIAVVVASPGERLHAWSEALLPGISAGLALPSWTLAGWEVQPVEADLPELAFARSVLFNLGALGTLALVVAWLLVYQAGVIWLRRRELTLVRLRQLGVSELELGRGFLLGLTSLGLVSAGIGIGLGDALGRALAGVVGGYATAGLPVPGLDGWVVAKALGSATLVCAAGGWLAYRRETVGTSRPAVKGLVCAAVLSAGILGLVGTDSLAGGFLGIAALALLVLLAVSPLLELLRRGAGRLGGSLLFRSGARELFWYPGDLAVAMGALVLALATSVAIAAMVDSFRSDFERMLDQRLSHDLFLEAGGQDVNRLADALASLPGVSRVQRYGRSTLSVSGLVVEVGFTRFDAYESRRYGLESALPPGGALVSERLAREAGRSIGDRLDGTGLTVAGIFPGYGDATPRLVVDETDARRLGIPVRYDRLAVNAADPTPVRQTAEAFTGVRVEERAAVRGRALEVFEQTFAITGALTLLALIVAAVGLYNALLAMALQRQRTGRLLDALGVTAGELWRIDAGRTAATCVLVLMLALPLGLAMGALLCGVINPRAFGWSLRLAPEAGSLVWPALTALAVMVVTAMLPVPLEEIPDAE